MTASLAGCEKVVIEPLLNGQWRITLDKGSFNEVLYGREVHVDATGLEVSP